MSVCLSVHTYMHPSACPVHGGKTADRIRMPFGIIGQTGPGMRQVVERSTGRGTFGAEFGACHCNQWAFYGTCVRQRRDVAIFPNYFGQTCSVLVTVSASNDLQVTWLPSLRSKVQVCLLVCAAPWWVLLEHAIMLQLFFDIECGTRVFSALCVYLKFGHHPHPLGYLCSPYADRHAGDISVTVFSVCLFLWTVVSLVRQTWLHSRGPCVLWETGRHLPSDGQCCKLFAVMVIGVCRDNWRTCAKFCLCNGLHCWANPWRKIAYSLTHLLITSPKCQCAAE